MPNDVFIGLSLDTTVSYPPYSYIYTNGLVPMYLPWGSAGEPDNQATDFCIRLARTSSLGFHTISCGASYDYLCSSGIYKLFSIYIVQLLECWTNILVHLVNEHCF